MPKTRTKIKKKLKFATKREFWVKMVIIMSTVALIATSVLPYILS